MSIFKDINDTTQTTQPVAVDESSSNTPAEQSYTLIASLKDEAVTESIAELELKRKTLQELNAIDAVVHKVIDSLTHRENFTHLHAVGIVKDYIKKVLSK